MILKDITNSLNTKVDQAKEALTFIELEEQARASYSTFPFNDNANGTQSIPFNARFLKFLHHKPANGVDNFFDCRFASISFITYLEYKRIPHYVLSTECNPVHPSIFVFTHDKKHARRFDFVGDRHKDPVLIRTHVNPKRSTYKINKFDPVIPNSKLIISITDFHIYFKQWFKSNKSTFTWGTFSPLYETNIIKLQCLINLHTNNTSYSDLADRHGRLFLNWANL